MPDEATTATATSVMSMMSPPSLAVVLSITAVVASSFVVAYVVSRAATVVFIPSPRSSVTASVAAPTPTPTPTPMFPPMAALGVIMMASRLSLVSRLLLARSHCCDMLANCSGTPSATDIDGVRAGSVLRRDGQAKGAGQGLLLHLLHLPDLLLALALRLLLGRLVRRACAIFPFSLSLASLCVPSEVLSLRPATDRSLQAVAEVVLPVVGGCDVFPVEIDAAARPALADARDEIHRAAGNGGYYASSINMRYSWYVGRCFDDGIRWNVEGRQVNYLVPNWNQGISYV